jgi:mono/diheme cytochrome c family protein
MIASAKSKSVLLLLLLFFFASIAAAQEKGVKKAPIQTTSPANGAVMYKSYCASCHGKTGEGNGPAAEALNTKPADLATLSERHGGKFPESYVATVLRFGVKAPAHGSADMPTWGPLLGSASGGDAMQVNMRISNLIAYLKTLQKKPAKK